MPYCIFESAMAFEMGTARRERQIVREIQRLHDHGISGRLQVHFRREPSGVYPQLTPLRTGMKQRDPSYREQGLTLRTREERQATRGCMGIRLCTPALHGCSWLVIFGVDGIVNLHPCHQASR